MARLIVDYYLESSPLTYKELPDFYQQQMGCVATLMFGEEYTTPEDLIAQMTQAGCEIEIEIIDIYHVFAEEDPGKVLYHVWKYMDEYGSVFYADTLTDAEIGHSNFTFTAYDSGNAEKVKLAEDLQKAFYE
jgi:hypothetical protein